MTVKLIKKREICFHETINDAENEKNYGNHVSDKDDIDDKNDK